MKTNELQTRHCKGMIVASDNLGWLYNFFRRGAWGYQLNQCYLASVAIAPFIKGLLLGNIIESTLISGQL